VADENTTAVVQRYLDALTGDTPVEPIVRGLLDRAVGRLHRLCATMLYKHYPRLTRSPLSLQPDELLGAVVERLLKALREARPATVRHFFILANQHIRWELNDLARRLDQGAPAVGLPGPHVPAPESSGSGLSPAATRILQAIDALPDEEKEVFSLVRIQGMTHSEVAGLLGISAKTVQRRLSSSVVRLTEMLLDLRPED
jgi:RNA polymerase sigma-70 factor (ECF subfamily)